MAAARMPSLPLALLLLLGLFSGSCPSACALESEEGASFLFAGGVPRASLATESGVDEVVGLAESRVPSGSDTQSSAPRSLKLSGASKLADRGLDEEVVETLPGGNTPEDQLAFGKLLMTVIIGGLGLLSLRLRALRPENGPGSERTAVAALMAEERDSSNELSALKDLLHEARQLEALSAEVKRALTIVKGKCCTPQPELASLVTKLDEARSRVAASTAEHNQKEVKDLLGGVSHVCEEASAVMAILERMKACRELCLHNDWSELDNLREQLSGDPGRSMLLSCELVHSWCKERDAKTQVKEMKKFPNVRTGQQQLALGHPHPVLPTITDRDSDSAQTEEQAESAQYSWTLVERAALADTANSSSGLAHVATGEGPFRGVHSRPTSQGSSRIEEELIASNQLKDREVQLLTVQVWQENCHMQWERARAEEKDRKEVEARAETLNLANMQLLQTQQVHSAVLAVFEDIVKVKEEEVRLKKDEVTKAAEAEERREAWKFRYRIAKLQMLMYLLVRAVVYWQEIVALFPSYPAYVVCIPRTGLCQQLHGGWDASKSIAKNGPTVLIGTLALGLVTAHLGWQLGRTLLGSLALVAAVAMLWLWDALMLDLRTRVILLGLVIGFSWVADYAWTQYGKHKGRNWDPSMHRIWLEIWTTVLAGMLAYWAWPSAWT